MAKEKSLYYEDNTKGRIIGNFHLHDKKRALRRTLCSIDEANYSITKSGRKVLRTDAQKAEYLHKMYIEQQRKIDKEVKEEPLPKDRSRSVKLLSDRWMRTVIARRSSNTVSLYDRTLDYYNRAVGLDYQIDDHASDHINLFINHLNKQKLSSETVKSHLRHLQAFFNWACNELQIRRINIGVGRQSEELIENFSQTELKKLEQLILEKHDSATTEHRKMMFYNDYRAFMLLLNTGFRRTEALSLLLKNILYEDDQPYEIRVTENEEFGFKPKKERKRIMPIVKDDFKKFLKDDFFARGNDEKYFLDKGNGNPYLTSPDRFTNRFHDYCEEAGIFKTKSRLKPIHAFRSTFITELARRKVSTIFIMRIVGHSQISTTEKYVKAVDVDIRDALSVLNE